MKIETNKKSGFEPIELKITIESLAELKYLWLMSNQSTLRICEGASIHIEDDFSELVEDHALELFKKLDSLRKEYRF